MDFDAIRPLISGVVGALLTLWLTKRWSGWVPAAFEGKRADQLVAENRTSIITANVLFFGTIAAGIYYFNAGYAARNSWGHGLLIIGLAVLAGAAGLLVRAIGKGRARAAEAIVAFAIAERTPLAILAVIAVTGGVCLATGLGMLFGG